MRVAFRPAAARDLAEASAWYESDRPGRGERFLVAVRRILSLLASHPEAFPTVHGAVRRAMVGRFPYALYYRIARHSHVEVVACLHTWREPEDPVRA